MVILIRVHERNKGYLHNGQFNKAELNKLTTTIEDYDNDPLHHIVSSPVSTQKTFLCVLQMFVELLIGNLWPNI